MERNITRVIFMCGRQRAIRSEIRPGVLRLARDARLPDGHAVAARALGRVERGIGGFDQRAPVLEAALRGARHAHAGRQHAVRAVLVRHRQCLDRRTQPLGMRKRLRRAGLGQQQHELLAAVTRRAVAGPPSMRADRPRHRRERAVAGRVAVAVVEALEAIDVDHHHRQRLTRTPRAQPFVVGARFEGAAIRQRRERVGARERAQFVLHAFAAAQLTREHQRERDQRRIEQRRQRADDPRAHAPFRIDVARRHRDAEHERIALHAPEREPAPHAVERPDAEKTARLDVLEPVKQRRIGEILADHRARVGAAHQQRAVGERERDHAVRADLHAAHQLTEIVEPHGADDHARERAVGLRKAAAQADGCVGGAVARNEGAAHVEPHVRCVALHDEVVAVRDVDLARRRSARVENHVAGLVRHENHAQMLRRGRAVEQHVLADIVGQFGDARIAERVDHGLQGQLVDLQIARRIALEQQRHVVRGGARARERVFAHLRHDPARHRRKHGGQHDADDDHHVRSAGHHDGGACEAVCNRV
ncbi:hypothetical protein PT2222_10273 [Paraburkholderia tropica]